MPKVSNEELWLMHQGDEPESSNSCIDFVQAIRQGSPVAASGEDGLYVVVQAAFRSPERQAAAL